MATITTNAPTSPQTRALGDESKVGEFTNGLVYEVGFVGRPGNNQTFLVVRRADGEDRPVKQHRSDSELLPLLGLQPDQAHVLRALQPRTNRLVESLLQQIKGIQEEGRAPTPDEASSMASVMQQLHSETATHLDGDYAGEEVDVSITDPVEALAEAHAALELVYHDLWPFDKEATVLPVAWMEPLSQALAHIEAASVMVQPQEGEVPVVPEGTEGKDEADEGTNLPEASPESSPGVPQEGEGSNETDGGSDEDSGVHEPEPGEQPFDAPTEDLGEPELPSVEVQRSAQELSSLLSQSRDLLARMENALAAQTSVQRSAPSLDDFKSLLQESLAPLQQKMEQMEQDTQKVHTRLQSVESLHQSQADSHKEQSEAMGQRLEKMERAYQVLDNFHPGSRGASDPEQHYRHAPGSGDKYPGFGNVLNPKS